MYPHAHNSAGWSFAALAPPASNRCTDKESDIRKLNNVRRFRITLKALLKAALASSAGLTQGAHSRGIAKSLDLSFVTFLCVKTEKSKEEKREERPERSVFGTE
jgi:hypothetical protein